jgi:hypothetical protein
VRWQSPTKTRSERGPGKWEENNRPVGRDEEFWYRAEREFREAEKLAKEIRDDI